MNYVDRQVLGLLAPELQTKIGWNEVQYGYIVTAFQAAYAIGLLLMGRVIDLIGTRIGYALSIGIWSLAAAAHALARTPLGFGAARFALGIGEAGNFPAAIKTVAEWFPKKERALATGIFNSGTNVGATIGPLLVLWVASRYGWQFAFVSTGLLSFIPILFWVRTYRRPQEHPRLSAAELKYIQSDPSEPATRIPWTRLLPHRQTWAFLAGKFLTDPIWWFFLFWLPKFLNTNHGLALTQAWAASGGDLQRSLCGQHWRWLAGCSFSQSWLERKPRAQDCNADLRAGHRAHCCGGKCSEPVGSGGAGEPGNRWSPGMVRQHVYLRF